MEMNNLAALATAIPVALAGKSRQLSAKNCLLFDLTISNDDTADFYVQLWDVAAVGDIGGADADDAPDFEEVVPAGSFLPFGFNQGYQFHRGLYVRAVTALGGSTLIATDSARMAGRYLSPYPILTA